ncbi:MAG: hypothetical protein NUV54_02460 [Candidatus Taylorbacteria bacterium]|nr:hypothetical protein [Candidatus Taylorbacteria bacterium]
MKSFSEHPSIEPRKTVPDEGVRIETPEIIEVHEGADSFFDEKGGAVEIHQKSIDDVSEDARRIDLVRAELSEEERSEKVLPFEPVRQRGETFIPPRFKPKDRSLRGKFRQWLNIGLVGLGLMGSHEVQASDTDAPKKGGRSASGVPVFNAPAPVKTDTNVYHYDQKVFTPSPEQQEANRRAIEEAFAAREAIAMREQRINAEMGSQSPSSSAEATRGNFPVQGQRPSGGGPRMSRGAQMSRENFPVGGQYPAGGSGSVRGRGRGGGYTPIITMGNNPLEAEFGAYVHPGGSLPTEKRKLFGQEYDAITRHSVLGVGGPGHERPTGNKPQKKSPPRVR